MFNDFTANHLDTRDWAGGTNDAFNQFSSSGVVNPISAVDFQVMDVIGYGNDGFVGSVLETAGHITFLRAHELGGGYGKPPNFLDCEVIALVAEEPLRSFGFQLRADAEKPARWEMFEFSVRPLRPIALSVSIISRPVRRPAKSFGWPMLRRCPCPTY